MKQSNIQRFLKDPPRVYNTEANGDNDVTNTGEMRPGAKKIDLSS